MCSSATLWVLPNGCCGPQERGHLHLYRANTTAVATTVIGYLDSCNRSRNAKKGVLQSVSGSSAAAADGRRDDVCRDPQLRAASFIRCNLNGILYTTYIQLDRHISIQWFNFSIIRDCIHLRHHAGPPKRAPGPDRFAPRVSTTINHQVQPRAKRRPSLFLYRSQHQATQIPLPCFMALEKSGPSHPLPLHTHSTGQGTTMGAHGRSPCRQHAIATL